MTDAPRAPGADEVRARHNLRLAVRGFDSPAEPVMSSWWDELYDSAHDDHHRPDALPAPAPRLGDWRKGESTDLRGDRPDEVPEPPETKPEPVVEQLLDEEDEGEWEDVDEPEPQPVGRTAPARARRQTAGARAQHEYAQLPGRIRWLLYTGTAAAAGYWVQLAPLMEGWITDCGRDTGTSGALALGIGLVLACGVLIDRRTRGWWGPLPWLCRIPLASAVLALLLFAPGGTT
ncbi:hypothetical protein V2S66_03380 [Streptomyces sp. V4-01]|uniref:Uncharacterized protein n=1 Tax=Actinacidiphila polyblastidii TaxID=3110430 RepID=A0ABU7P5B9_9ACTN|nr:hypothetical protein [Streptomyces sp. V4-01]